MLRNLRIGLGLFLLAGSIVFLVWGYWPTRREVRARPVSPSGSTQAEQAALSLLFPPRIRVGEPGVVRLNLDVNSLKGFLPAAGESNSIFDSHHVIAEARFDIPGNAVQPSELVSAPVSQGQTAVFYWTLRPGEAGNFRGTIWLYVRAIDKLTGQESRETVSAQIVEIEAVKFLDFVVSQVRMIGLVGGVVGLFLSLPFFEAQTVKLLRKRREIL